MSADEPEPADNERHTPRELYTIVQPSQDEPEVEASEEQWQSLQEMLRQGVLVENSMWSFKMTDWVVGLQAADIDGDGEREIVIAARDGQIRAFTRYGSQKWEHALNDHRRISALAVRTPLEHEKGEGPRIILGLRSGQVMALNKDGADVFPEWHYETGRLVRSLATTQSDSDLVVIGSDDQAIHVISGASGELCWRYPTHGLVRSVAVCDLDGDNREEIIAGSSDQNVYIFDIHKNRLCAFDTGYSIYALAAAPLLADGPVHLLTGSNYKSLSAWEVTGTRDAGDWSLRKIWHRSARDDEPFFANRIHAICVGDLNDDGAGEILAGCEDGHLVVLDHTGELLWRRDFGACVNRISVVDLNYSGQLEVLVGTENSSVYQLQLELAGRQYADLRRLARQLARDRAWPRFVSGLRSRERTLLDNLPRRPATRPSHQALEHALQLIEDGAYELALTILLPLMEDRMHYCWSEPFQVEGYIWTGLFTSFDEGLRPELVVGTDQGYLYALELASHRARQHWCTRLADTERAHLLNPVRTIAAGPQQADGTGSLLAVRAYDGALLLDSHGYLLREQSFTLAQSWPRDILFLPGEASASGEIFVVEDQRILIFDQELTERVGQLETPGGCGAICVADLFGQGEIQIVAGSLKNGVTAYTRSGRLLWQFPTEDRVHAIHIADIDLDEHPEIIVGSEDRNLYVLDHLGNLKWRYPTGREVMSLDVCNARMPRESYVPRRLTPIILASSGDGYLYIFDGYGDLIWKHRFPNRVRLVRACQSPDQPETYLLAVAYENQVELLQLLDRDRLLELSNYCWSQWTNEYSDRALLRSLSTHPDKYLRGEALAILAGQEPFSREDSEYIERALREERTLQVKSRLIAAIVNLYRTRSNQNENVRYARKLLESLYRDPEREVRLQLVQIFPLVADTELFFGWFFENLERSTDHADEYVRRAVVRRLEVLFDNYPERENRRVFALLLKTANDPTSSWVRQETGRALAHYFDKNIRTLVSDLMRLLDSGTNLMILQQITHSVRNPALRKLFQNMRRQMTDLHPTNLVRILDEAIASLRQINSLGPDFAEEWLQIYEEFRQFASARSISDLAGYQRITRPESLCKTPFKQEVRMIQVFDTLEQVARTIALYERRQTVGERVATLILAQRLMESLRSVQPYTENLLSIERQEAHAPENRILTLLVDQWREVIQQELAHISGSADLKPKLLSTVVARAPEVVISIQIRNEGECAADNVCIELASSPAYEILADQRQMLAEISTRVPALLEFHLRFHSDSARLAFMLTYDDAERKGKRLPFADQVQMQDNQREYHFIANPYTTGTPIRQPEKFYGRSEDLDFLQESLGSQSTNRVVLLWGQRRMGKTSLIYRLASQLAEAGPFAPAFIDMQKMALKANEAQLLEGFARNIREQVLEYKRVTLAEPERRAFEEDPSTAFESYLENVWQALPGHRLILLIDEFDDIRQYVSRQGDRILRYLRSLMQHYPRLNFLLAGAIPYTEGYQAVFFNIAQARELGRFKRNEAEALITMPVSRDLEYDSLALEKMLNITNGWPYFIHVMSEKLIQHCNAIQKAYVTVAEVNTALKSVLFEQETSIRWIWHDLASPLEKLILALLAQERGEEGRIFSLNEIHQQLDHYAIPYEPRQVTEALSHLVNGRFVEEYFEGVQYRIPVGLLKAWLRKEKPPGRVVREENFFVE